MTRWERKLEEKMVRQRRGRPQDLRNWREKARDTNEWRRIDREVKFCRATR